MHTATNIDIPPIPIPTIIPTSVPVGKLPFPGGAGGGGRDSDVIAGGVGGGGDVDSVGVVSGVDGGGGTMALVAGEVSGDSDDIAEKLNESICRGRVPASFEVGEISVL